jgi:hypothetical protein
MIHLAIEKLIQGKFIKKDPGEDFVTSWF